MSVDATDPRTYGAFYTPENVAEALTRWAVRDASDTVFDPSYGGCAFFSAALRVLGERKCATPERQIFGVDRDPAARSYIEPLVNEGALPSQFIDRDFFRVAPADFEHGPFSAAVGNPPFIRYHRIDPGSKSEAIARLAESGWSVSGRASYWAYFLLYAVRYIKPGGRLAMLLPGAFLHTEYAGAVRDQLARAFETVYLFPIRERLFQETQEEVVAVCAEGAHCPSHVPQIRVGAVEGAQGLARALERPDDHSRPFVPRRDGGGWLRALVEPEAIEAYDRIVTGAGVIRLGDVAVPQIGVVTGNNGFFILSEEERRERQLPRDAFQSVVRRLAHLPGLRATDDDIRELVKDGRRTLLLAPSADSIDSALQAYLDEGEAAGVAKAQKCRTRSPWYVPKHAEAPPAFVQCMTASWPRIVVNDSAATCTNNVIRLSWRPSPELSIQRDDDPLTWTTLALGALSSLSQLSAELVGRSYGGGILKVEPTELKRLALPVLPSRVVNMIAPVVDRHLRSGNPASATAVVDAAMLKVMTDVLERDLNLIRIARNALLLRRRQHRDDANRIVEKYSSNAS